MRFLKLTQEILMSASVARVTEIIASSTKNECVALYCAQLVDLDVGEENALAGA